MFTARDLDETARLVLMDNPSGPWEFVQRIRAEYPTAGLVECTDLWRKYCGLDGRSRPTHDYMTGNPL